MALCPTFCLFSSVQFFLSYGREVAMETKDFVIKENIGRGAFAHVYCATYKDGKEVGVAVLQWAGWGDSWIV